MKKNENGMATEKEIAKQNPLRSKMNRKVVIKILIFAVLAMTIYSSTIVISPSIKLEIINAMISKAESYGLDDTSVFVTGKEKIDANQHYLVTIDSSNFGDLMPEQMIAIAERLSLKDYYIKNTFTSQGDSYWIDLSLGLIYKNGEEIYSRDATLDAQQPSSSIN